jgi:hypothetical protein
MTGGAFVLRALVASLLAVTAAQAETATFQKQAPGASQRVVTPADMDKRLEQQAEATKRIAPKAARVALVDFAWPESEAEYRALGKFIVVLVVAVSQTEQELPLKQLYVAAGGRTVALQKIASERRTLPEGSDVATVLGRYREDAFYVAPAAPMMRKGYLLIDFAINRSGLRVYELPGTPPDFVRKDRNPNPAKGAKPDVKALQAMIEREYPGFRLTPVAP